MSKAPLNLFYEEPDPDRWLPWDHHPRRIIRRIIRGKGRVGGQQRVFLNLCAGLDLLGADYRINDYRHINRHPREVAGIVGKSHVLDKIAWRNPILLGAAVTGHPMDDLHLLKRLPIRRILVPGEWLRLMYVPYYGNAVSVWPVGINTERWKPVTASESTDKDKTRRRPETSEGVTTNFLLYDKVRWEHDRFEGELIGPIRDELRRRGLSFNEIRYGFYEEEEFERLLRSCQAMIFLCEHETQGIAYQQALACGVPILAWDRGGMWQDPEFYPHRLQFGPVSAVPYWDERCGVKFQAIEEFKSRLDEFLRTLDRGEFAPRDYILENLTLESCAREYVAHYRRVEEGGAV